MIQGGQPLVGGPQLNVNRIMQGFDDTLAAHPKTWQNDDETYTTIVRYEEGNRGKGIGNRDEEETLSPIPYSLSPSSTPIPYPLFPIPSNKSPIPSTQDQTMTPNTATSKPVYDARENSGALQMVAVDLVKSYRKGKLVVPVLKGVNLGIREGEMLAIVGQSGSGKSTLLHLLGTLDSPDSGSIHFDGQRIDALSSGQRDLLRNQFIGMIFQFYHLIPEMTTLENVLSPIMIRESVWGYMTKRKQYRQKATELLERVGLGHRLRHKPNELSGGEMQRAAIARALISNPQIILADEPTGNLDLNSAKEVLKLLCDLNREEKVTILMVTHDPGIAREADRTIRLVDGRVMR